MPTVKEYPELHMKGHLTVEPEKIERLYRDADVGIQIAEDGRIWLCVNGQSLIRFVPSREGGEK